MCRADVDRQAAPLLAQLLDTIAHRLAADHGVDRAGVLIGPVDFGDPHEIGKENAREQ